MQIPYEDWVNFKDKMAALSQTAATEFAYFIEKNGGYENIPVEDVITVATALVRKYGEGAGALAAIMYDAIADLEQAAVPAADVAEPATYNETAKAVQGTAKTSVNPLVLGAVVGRLVKQVGADTMLRNAKRDGAQIAWIAFGDTCAYCIMQAAKGWIYVPDAQDHAEHIHGNCDCTYSVRFNDDTFIEGYTPDKFKRMYSAADGRTQEQKLNSMRREFYAENKAEINAQKRSAYAKRQELDGPSAEEFRVNG